MVKIGTKMVNIVFGCPPTPAVHCSVGLNRMLNLVEIIFYLQKIIPKFFAGISKLLLKKVAIRNSTRV